MNLKQFKDNIVTLKYIDSKIIDEQTFEIDVEHLSEVSKIASDIGVSSSFTDEEIALTKIAALLHDMYKTKTNKETHAKDAADLIDGNDSLQLDLGILLYEEFYLHFTPRMLTTISCAVRNHKKMDGLKEYQLTEQMYKIALVVYAADKIDKFRTDADYSDDKFNEKMKKAYGKTHGYSNVVEMLQTKIDIIKDKHKNDYARTHV